MGRRRKGFNAGAGGVVVNSDLEPSEYGYPVTLVTGQTYRAPHGDGPSGSTEIVVDAHVHSKDSGSPVRQIAADAIELDM